MTDAKKLFLCGLGVHLLYITILLTTNSIFSGFWHKDDGSLTEEIAGYHVDSRSYIKSAENYLEYGVFGNGNAPDYHRTIGYPFIICLFKVLFGKYWYMGLVFFQSVLGAFIYPVAYRIGITIFPDNKKKIFYSVAALILLGGYFTKSLYVMSDLSFAAFFLAGVYLSIVSVIKKKSYTFMTLGIVSLTLSGLIRPGLILYPAAHLLLLIFVSKYYNVWKQKRIKIIVWVSTIILIFTCNFSAFRVHRYYNSFSPTDVLGINMFQYSVKEILSKEGEERRYEKMKNEIDDEKNWLTQDKMRKKYFFETISEYPFSAMSYWIGAAQAHLFTPHYMETGSAYGYFKRAVDDKNAKLKKSAVMAGVFYFFYLVNIFITLLCFLNLLKRFFIQKEYLFVISVFAVIFFITGPSFIAETGPRMRIPVEPFILIVAFDYTGNLKKNILKRIGKRQIAM